jgi:archaellum component FlaG (FlaF/FlaG flagellin family)
METSLLLGLRNVLFIGALLTATSVVPGLSTDANRLLLRIRQQVKDLRQSIKAWLRNHPSEKFWEIDMTKFEP